MPTRRTSRDTKTKTNEDQAIELAEGEDYNALLKVNCDVRDTSVVLDSRRNERLAHAF